MCKRRRNGPKGPAGAPQQWGDPERGCRWDMGTRFPIRPIWKCLGSAGKLRFPDERKCLESAEDQSPDPSVARLWLLVLAQEPPAPQSSAYPEKKRAGGFEPYKRAKLLPTDKTTPCSHRPTLGTGGLKAFCMRWEVFQDIPSACDVCMCERGLCCWKGLFKYLYSPSLLVSCPQMRSP